MLPCMAISGTTQYVSNRSKHAVQERELFFNDYNTDVAVFISQLRIFKRPHFIQLRTVLTIWKKEPVHA